MLEIPYSLALTTHIAAFFFSLLGIIVADSQGLRWLLGWRQTLSRTFLSFWHRWVWVGISVSILSGGWLFWQSRTYLLGEPTFLLKVALVFVLCFNAVFIGKHLEVAATRSFAELTRPEQRVLLFSAAVSTFCWVAVFTLGKLLPL